MLYLVSYELGRQYLTISHFGMRKIMKNLEIKIFLSSTFNINMLRARDAFRNEMLAKLNAIAGQIQGNVYLNDYELGIPEGTDALTVVCTCLDAIMDSDYFVGIMGEDRGTLLLEYLQDSDWSGSRYSALIAQAIQSNFTVLELEFMCAVQSGIKAYFFWNTKRKIIMDCNKSIEEYLLLNNQCITGFTYLEELKHSVIEALEAEWNLKYSLFSSYSQQEKDTNIILANKIRYYVPNTKCLKQIDDYVNSKLGRVLWITGKSRIGKSTVLFDWFNSHLEDEEYHVLFFTSEYISASLDELIFQIIYEIENIENQDFISKYQNLINDLERADYFKTVLEKLRQPYVILIDGLEHIFSHAGIKASFCLPEQLQPNVKIVVTWGEDASKDKDGTSVVLDGFDIGSFVEIFFKREGKILIYHKYKEQISQLLRPNWSPDATRLMLSCLIVSAKYNNIESAIAEFVEEYEKYGNPYCSYIIWLNKYFTVNGNEPLKEALLLLFHSKNGITLTLLQTAVPSGEKLKEIFNIIYFLLQKNTYNRYLISNVYLRSAIEILYHEELFEYGSRLSNLNYMELLSKSMEESYDIWEEYLVYLSQNGKVNDLERLFTEYLGKIANLWYYNSELLLRVFEIVKCTELVEKIKKRAMEDTESNAPFFVSHLLYELGYYKDAVDIYEYLELNRNQFNLSENDYATVLNNMGIYFSLLIGEEKRSEEYLLKGYQLRKKHFLENKKAFFESCDNLFEFYLRCCNKEAAIKYLQEEIELCETCFRENSQENMKCNISRAYWEEDNNPLRAFYYYDQALSICNNIFEEDNLQSAKVYQMKGSLYIKTGNYKLALESGNKADDIFEKRGIYNADRVYIYNLLASASLALEKQVVAMESTLGDSKSWFRKALQLSKNIAPENYNNNLNRLLSEFPDTSEEYWSSSGE